MGTVETSYYGVSIITSYYGVSIITSYYGVSGILSENQNIVGWSTFRYSNEFIISINLENLTSSSEIFNISLKS